MNPALTERLTGIAHAADALGHGEKTAYLAGEADKLGWSMDKLYRHLKRVTVSAPRKRRADAGLSVLSMAEAKLISAAVLEGARKNGKRIMTIGRAAQMLRANGKIRAEQVDEESGEVRPLSDSTLARALRDYGLHPDQLLQPDPAVRMKSLHPNHCWQIDPSLCVLYYLPRSGEDTGLRIADAAEFYKNKPANVAKIEHDRVWRYVISDHYSGCLFVHYVFGGETAQNLCDAFIAAMQPAEDISRDPFRGVPKMVMLDPGSANTSAAFKTLCSALGVHLQVNKPKNPRAKGQVENGNDIVETAFESGLRFVNIARLDDLNSMANRWMRYYNGTETHSRHGETRYRMWNRIGADELILPPAADYCRELAVSMPKEAKVNVHLEIKFGGQVYSVKGLDVLVGQKVLVAKNPWRPEAAQVALQAAGQEVWHVLEPMAFDEAGFAVDAAVIGEQYKSAGDTRATTARKELAMLAMGVTTQEAEAHARKANALPFGGTIDPYKHQEAVLEADKTRYISARGTAHEFNKLEVVQPTLNLVELAKLFKPRIDAAGGNWANALSALQRDYPAGCAADKVEDVYAVIERAGSLRIVRTG